MVSGYRIIRPDGAVRTVYRENDVQYDAEGRPIRRIVTFKDITEIKATEARLEQTQEDLNRAQRLAKVGSDVRDLRTGEVSWSDEAYRIFGVDPDTFIPTSENLLSLSCRKIGQTCWPAGNKSRGANAQPQPNLASVAQTARCVASTPRQSSFEMQTENPSAGWG
jgi:hypothetical protein